MKTALIIGDSPFLGEVQDKLLYVLNRYDSFGMNSIVKRYKTNAHIFLDMLFIPLTNALQDMKTVTLYSYGDAIQKENKELIDEIGRAHV